jgi:hypothetical protein
MATYNKPPMNNLPFIFGSGGYSKPDFGAVGFNFTTRDINNAVSSMGASINALGQDYIKECPTYVVGYGVYGVQIIKGRCIYGGFRDMTAFIKALKGKEIPADLPASINGLSPFEHGSADLSASITSFVEKYLTANITGILPIDLGGQIRVWQRTVEDLAASIRGWQTKDLSASILGIIGYDLPASVVPIPPKDLPAYLKVWPQEDLPASIYGWQEKDLGASISTFQNYDLSANIGAHPWIDLGARLKGWGREVPADLQGIIGAVAFEDLPAIIRATYLKDLSAYIFAVAPKDLPASIHGYQTTDLPANIIGDDYPFNLTSSINGTGGFSDLPATIFAAAQTNVFNNLSARVTSWYERNLQAIINVATPGNLSASLYAQGGSSDLSARIYPKMVRLSTIVSLVTMEASELSAVINVCGGSASANLSASLLINHTRDLAATILGSKLSSYTGNLGASIGYANSYSVLDKLPLSIIIREGTYRVYDKMTFRMELSRAAVSLFASIYGEYTSNDLAASIEAEQIGDYSFETSKNRERVYFNLGQNGVSYETVELAFTEIVSDYFFNSGTGQVYKTNPLDRWITRAESFVPKDTRLNIKRRLHKGSVLNDISKFNDIDEAVRYVIDYITFYPKEDLRASITATGQFNNLGASVNI